MRIRRSWLVATYAACAAVVIIGGRVVVQHGYGWFVLLAALTLLLALVFSPLLPLEKVAAAQPARFGRHRGGTQHSG